MKFQLPRTVVSSFLLAAAGLMAFALAGPLSPPAGPIASTYKTLTEIEPRIILNAVNTPGNAQFTHVINQPGSYYLDADVHAAPGMNGVRINADNVTLDLNGFTIRGNDSLPTVGIDGSARGFALRNGSIRGFAYGAFGKFDQSVFEDLSFLDNPAGSVELSNPVDSIFRRLRIVASGEAGIQAGSNAVVTECAVNGSASGISLLFGGVVSNCTVNGAGTGVSLFHGGTVRDCTITNCNFGIQAGTGASATNCTISGSGQTGIEVGPGACVRECQITSCAIGIADTTIFFGRATLDSNSLWSCPIGVKLFQPGSIVTRNGFHDCATPVQAAAGNSVGTVVSTPVGAGAWDNISK